MGPLDLLSALLGGGGAQAAALIPGAGAPQDVGTPADVPLPPERPADLGPSAVTPASPSVGAQTAPGVVLARLRTNLEQSANQPAPQHSGFLDSFGALGPTNNTSKTAGILQGLVTALQGQRAGREKQQLSDRQNQTDALSRLKTLFDIDQGQAKAATEATKDARTAEETKRWHDILAQNYGKTKAGDDPLTTATKWNRYFNSIPEVQDLRGELKNFPTDARKAEIAKRLQDLQTTEQQRFKTATTTDSGDDAESSAPATPAAPAAPKKMTAPSRGTMDNARKALQSGASKDAIRKRLQDGGLDPSFLDQQ